MIFFFPLIHLLSKKTTVDSVQLMQTLYQMARHPCEKGYARAYFAVISNTGD